MKHISAIIKKEFLDLFKQRTLVHVLFLGFLILELVSFLFSEYFIEKIVAYIFFPFLLCAYLRYATQRKIAFVLAVLLNLLGEYFFSNTFETYNPIGLVFHGFSFFVYAYMLFSLFGLISLKVIMKFSIPMIVFIWLPTWLFSRGMNEQDMFNESLFYVFAVTLYIFSVFALHSTIKSKNTVYLKVSVFFLVASAYIAAYNVFVGRSGLSVLAGDFFFYVAHYLICWFFIVHHKPRRDRASKTK